jgi:lipopolysaccharide/colanic/teichoic acid biosynthesis glycosyltransferase
MSVLHLDTTDFEHATSVLEAVRNEEISKGPGVYERFAKRAIDLLGAAALLLVALPLFVFVALAVRISMGSGVIYRQARVGRGGKPFVIYKFRTMLHDRRAIELNVDNDRRVCHKRDDDPRHTSLGRFLRRTSLDELPQLWNVIKGDMSLVGPRPELVGVVRKYEDWQHLRHTVRPGITGLWQVSQRGAGLMCENLQADMDYVRSMSLWTDLKILARTPVAAVRRTGS